MKARIIETGKWIDVCRKLRIGEDVYVEYGTGEEYYYNQLILENEDKISSYWFDLRNQYAGMAMQAFISNGGLPIKTDDPKVARAYLAKTSVQVADALIEILKEK